MKYKKILILLALYSISIFNIVTSNESNNVFSIIEESTQKCLSENINCSKEISYNNQNGREKSLEEKIRKHCPEAIIAQKIESSLNQKLADKKMQNEETFRKAIVHVFNQYKEKTNEKLNNKIINYILSIYDPTAPKKLFEGCFNQNFTGDKVIPIMGGRIEVVGYFTYENEYRNQTSYYGIDGDNFHTIPTIKQEHYIFHITNNPKQNNTLLGEKLIFLKNKKQLYTRNIFKLFSKNSLYYHTVLFSQNLYNTVSNLTNEEKKIAIYIPLQIKNLGSETSPYYQSIFYDIRIVE